MREGFADRPLGALLEGAFLGVELLPFRGELAGLGAEALAFFQKGILLFAQRGVLAPLVGGRALGIHRLEGNP